MAKIGDIIENKHGLFVITKLTHGIVSDTEKLEDYIVKNAFVKVDNEWITIQDVIQNRCKMYLESDIDIIKA